MRKQLAVLLLGLALCAPMGASAVKKPSYTLPTKGCTVLQNEADRALAPAEVPEQHEPIAGESPVTGLPWQGEYRPMLVQISNTYGKVKIQGKTIKTSGVGELSPWGVQYADIIYESYMKREIVQTVRGMRAVDGAGVRLVRVLSNENVRDFDPFLMLDSFDSTDPTDYIAGFPMHPHRGIETLTYLISGRIEHQDTLGNKGVIHSGECQWMTAGSGILHQEMPKPAERMVGSLAAAVIVKPDVVARIRHILVGSQIVIAADQPLFFVGGHPTRVGDKTPFLDEERRAG